MSAWGESSDVLLVRIPSISIPAPKRLIANRSARTKKEKVVYVFSRLLPPPPHFSALLIQNALTYATHTRTHACTRTRVSEVEFRERSADICMAQGHPPTHYAEHGTLDPKPCSCGDPSKRLSLCTRSKIRRPPAAPVPGAEIRSADRSPVASSSQGCSRPSVVFWDNEPAVD